MSLWTLATSIRLTFSSTTVNDLKTAAYLLECGADLNAVSNLITPELTQVTLSAGVSDIDGTIKDERIAHASGAVTEAGMTESELVRLLQDAGRVPVRRDALYNELQVYA